MRQLRRPGAASLLAAAVLAAVVTVIVSTGPVAAQEPPSSTTSTLPPESTTTTSTLPPESTTTSTEPATTTTATTTTAPPAVPADPADPDVVALAPEVAPLPVDSHELIALEAAKAETAAALIAAQADRIAAAERVVALEAENARLEGVIATESERRARASAAVEAARDDVRDLAVARYVHGNNADLTAVILNDLERGTEAAGERVLIAHVSDAQLGQFRAALREHRSAIAAVEAARTARTEVRSELARQTELRDRAAADEARLTELAIRQGVDIDRARATGLVAGTDLPLVALDAYWRAARALALERPDCGLPWWALAGIGRVESNHGRIQPSTIEPDGETSTLIIGRRLDGSPGTRRIVDSDGGLMDGDVEFDRAVGPMQFIPTTWARHARDGNGDGLTDPHNIYDAARTAAQYLCAGGPMNAEGHIVAGFLRYNHSQPYADRVLALGYGYQTAVTGLPAPAPVPPAPAPPG